MKINEILDSTQSWSNIAGIEVAITSEFQQKYRQIVQALTMLLSLKTILPYEIWAKSVTDIMTEIQIFSTLANNYLSSVEKLNIKNDADLNSRIKKVTRMKMNIANYLDHIVA